MAGSCRAPPWPTRHARRGARARFYGKGPARTFRTRVRPLAKTERVVILARVPPESVISDEPNPPAAGASEAPAAPTPEAEAAQDPLESARAEAQRFREQLL